MRIKLFSTTFSLLLLLGCQGADEGPGPAPGPLAATPAPVSAPAATAEVVSTEAPPAGGGLDESVAAVVEQRAPKAAPSAHVAQPPAVAGVRSLLLARDVEDLPAREVLNKHEGAAAALAWLASNDDRLIVRARAADRLGLFPGVAGDPLLAILRDEGQPPKVRAGALQGLGRLPLQELPSLRAEVESRLRDPALPVSVAAAKALSGVTAAAPALRQIADQEQAPGPLKRAAAEALR